MTASGWGLLFMGMKCAGIRQWGRLHDSVKILTTTELYIL